jgi:hypothetical protein
VRVTRRLLVVMLVALIAWVGPFATIEVLAAQHAVQDPYYVSNGQHHAPTLVESSIRRGLLGRFVGSCALTCDVDGWE